LAYSARASAENLFPSPGDVSGGNTATNTDGMGQVLQLEINMETVALREVNQVPFGFSDDFETVPANVCKYRNRH
jgi:hypothetical protein